MKEGKRVPFHDPSGGRSLENFLCKDVSWWRGWG